MTLYELLLFVHIAASIVWIGAGLPEPGPRQHGYDRESDEVAMQALRQDQEWLAMRLFIPASLTVVIFGIALVIESDAWSFDQLWIVLGLDRLRRDLRDGAVLHQAG